jgi:hypothetical protein
VCGAEFETTAESVDVRGLAVTGSTARIEPVRDVTPTAARSRVSGVRRAIEVPKSEEVGLLTHRQRIPKNGKKKRKETGSNVMNRFKSDYCWVWTAGFASIIYSFNLPYQL